jgi:hypothetical protein
MEERILRSVNDQVDVAMTRVNATIVRELMEKMEYIEVKVGQQIGGSLASSPNLRSTEGFRGPIHDKAEIRASGRIQGPKQEFLVFSGDDPDEWLAQCEYIFEMYETPENQKVIQAATNFRGEGSWCRGYRSTREHPSWQHLMELIKVRFFKTEGVSSYEELKNLVQQGSVRNYMKQFEIVKSRSQVEFSYLPESHYITAFISGLWKNIKHLVPSQNHTNFLDAYQYAKHMEVALDFQFGNTQYFVENLEKETLMSDKSNGARNSYEETNLAINKENSRNARVEHRRALGLCFKCGEKYYFGHQCKVKIHMMIGQEEDSEQQLSDFVVEDNYNLKGKGVSGAQEPAKR